MNEYELAIRQQFAAVDQLVKPVAQFDRYASLEIFLREVPLIDVSNS